MFNCARRKSISYHQAVNVALTRALSAPRWMTFAHAGVVVDSFVLTRGDGALDAHQAPTTSGEHSVIVPFGIAALAAAFPTSSGGWLPHGIRLRADLQAFVGIHHLAWLVANIKSLSFVCKCYDGGRQWR